MKIDIELDNVLSLFDGMSCGQLALDTLGIKVKNYFASEIDSYAMQIAKKNYPNTKHIGSVPDNYTEGVSNTQRFKMLGNGWTIDVIAHILNEMRHADEPVKTKTTKQLELL